MKPAPFAYATAADSGAAVSLLAGSGESRPIGGGQSLGPMLNLRLARPATLIDIARAEDLRGVRDEGDTLLYGAAVTHAEIEDGLVPDATPGWLATAARGIAYRAVRNRGTIGGSLAHADPAADWVTVLTALGGEVVLASAGGTRTVTLAHFFVGPFTTALRPGELITGIRLRKRCVPARWGYWKYCRKVGEFAKASAAVLMDPVQGDVRILLGAIERPPVFLGEPQAILSGRIPVATAVREAAPELDPESTQLHVAAVRRAIAAAMGDRA